MYSWIVDFQPKPAFFQKFFLHRLHILHENLRKLEKNLRKLWLQRGKQFLKHSCAVAK